MVGIDPGRRNLFFSSENLDGDWENLYHRKHVREHHIRVTGQEEFSEWELLRRQKNGDYSAAMFALSVHNSKCSNLNRVLAFIHEDFRVGALSSEGTGDDPWGEMKNLKTLGQLGRLFMVSKQEKRKNFAKLVNILISMMYLYKMKRKKNWTHSDIYAPEPLAQRLAELYTFDKAVGAQIDREGTNKLFAHIVVFVLRLTPFWEFDFSNLKTDLNVQSKDLLAILSFCGISVKSRTGLAGKLTAPLTVHTNGGGKGVPKRKK
jgi:hypothetical protein